MKSPRFWMIAACMAVTSCAATVATAQAPADPPADPATGEVVVTSIEVTATVTQINHETREVTLMTDDGQEYSFVAGDAVENLAQVEKGDVVTATYVEALAYEVQSSGKAMGAEAKAAVGAADLGEKPAGVVASQVTVTVTIVAIDASIPSVTFEGPAGNTRTIKVLHPEKLEGVKVGDMVDITYAEAFAIKVEEAPEK